MVKKNISVLIIFLGIFLVFSGSPLQAENQTTAEGLEFLQENNQKINLDKPFEAFSLLDPYLEENKFFFTGETHRVRPNEKLRLEFLKYLHQNAGVRYYVPEATYSIAHFLNRYLQTGDEYYLDLTIPYWHRIAGVYEFFQELRAYNQTLEPHERIEIIGFDITGPFRQIISVIHLLEITPPDDAPDELAEPLEELAELKETFMEERQKPDHYYKAQTDFYAGIPDSFFDKILPPVEEIKQLLEENPGPIEKFLGEDFFSFQFIVQNIIDGFDSFELMFEGRWDSNEFRDRRSFENFLELYPDLDRGNFFGQWGDLHTFQEEYHGFPWLAAHLDSEESPLAGQVLSIFYTYDDCHLLERLTLDSPFPYSSDLEDMEIMQKAASGELVLFNLQGEDSPFGRELFFLGDDASGGTTLDYFQFMLYIKGFDRADPLYEHR